MKKLLLLLIFFPLLSFAQEEWEYVGSSTDKSEFYIKNAEKKSYGNRVLFWSKTVLPNKTIKTKKGTVNKKGGYNVVKYEADCDEKTLKMMMFASYESNGNPKDTDSGPFFAEPVIPDTMGETLLESSCTKFKN